MTEIKELAQPHKNGIKALTWEFAAVAVLFAIAIFSLVWYIHLEKTHSARNNAKNSSRIAQIEQQYNQLYKDDQDLRGGVQALDNQLKKAGLTPVYAPLQSPKTSANTSSSGQRQSSSPALTAPSTHSTTSSAPTTTPKRVSVPPSAVTTPKSSAPGNTTVPTTPSTTSPSPSTTVPPPTTTTTVPAAIIDVPLPTLPVVGQVCVGVGGVLKVGC